VNIDKNEFFRQAIIRLCSSLDIEKALFNCLSYVRSVMPADGMVLTVYHKDEGNLEVVATADEAGCTQRSDKILVPLSLRHSLEEPGLYPRVRMANDFVTDEIVKCVAEKYDWPDSSHIVVRLMVEGEFVGTLTIRANGKGRYTEDDAKLWELLNEPAAIALANSRRFLELEKLKEVVSDDSKYFQDELGRDYNENIIGAGFGLKGVMEAIFKVAPSSSPVLLFGETGTGKEVIAHAIHRLSARNRGPMITVNCGAIPESLIDSELFGHEKGAFTGATSQQRGRFERADGGTIFLDEVSELPVNAQVRLLRVLQEKEVERVGGSRPIKVDIRIISATNRDLKILLRDGSFRSDLYYRLGVFPVFIPPLRERKGDIPALADHFMAKKAKEMGLLSMPRLASGAIGKLMQYNWPGNVRELNNVIERAIIINKGKALTFNELLVETPEHIVAEKIAPPPLIERVEDLSLNSIEERHIRKVMEMTCGFIDGRRGAAAVLQIKPGTLRHRMRKLGIPFGKHAKEEYDK
jgi:transcriptional regulator with GAF, ATPase, and Fis domain